MSTTFLFTERYGTLDAPLGERLGTLVLPVVIALLVAGASWIFTLQASLADAVATALRAL
jgi:hypothetical protein